MTFPSLSQCLLVGFTLLALYLSYLAALDISSSISPQGCRMSYMSPSYVLQQDFDEKWTNLARRYSLWLYREVGWEDGKLPSGIPVVFIPGNAGASGQVRSIASSATRQYFLRPGVVAQEFEMGWKRSMKPLDFFALEFNEDLSAFHGPTLESQIRYTEAAISYILSLYPSETQVIVLGHSMGGIVATALLPSPNVSAIITMSTPHTLPPARFDARIDGIYQRTQPILTGDPTPIVSLCGGATDMMIPSESCILPEPLKAGRAGSLPYRRTVFTSALEGAWTGVGHREMVWCHQVRWRVARAALELGAASGEANRRAILDTWLRDGHTLPPPALADSGSIRLGNHDYEVLPELTDLVLKKPRGSTRTYLLPRQQGKFLLYVSGGSVNGLSPHEALPLRASVHICHHPADDDASVLCEPLPPTMLKLLPNPAFGKTFPVPHEGADESEGVVLFETDIGDDNFVDQPWIGVKVDEADGQGWVVAGFAPSAALDNDIGTVGLAISGLSVSFPSKSRLWIQVNLPNLLSNVLAVYKVSPKITEGITLACVDALLPPLVMHNSHRDETHYYPLIRTTTTPQSILLHSHGSAPYIPRSPGLERGLSISIYISGDASCAAHLEGIHLELDWSATLGRWASRYPTTLVCWVVGIVSLILFRAWGTSDHNILMPSVAQSLSEFVRRMLPRLLWASFAVSFIPFHRSMYLGNRGEPLLAFLAPLLLCLAIGIVHASWWVLEVLLWGVRKVREVWSPSWTNGQRRHAQQSTIISLVLMCCLIFLFVPWQVAYLGCWVYHFFTCTSPVPSRSLSTAPATPPITRLGDGENAQNERYVAVRESNCDSEGHNHALNNHRHNLHLLLFMTWLLPLTAPTLAVWVRTLITAGLTTPFDGDHNFLRVLPFLMLVDFASRTTEPLFPRQTFEGRWSIRWLFMVVALVATFFGARRVYVLFDVATFAIGFVVITRIGRRYWGA